MNVVRKLTLAHLKLNIARSAMTIFGIVVSVMLITTMFTGIASVLQYMGDVDTKQDGEYQAEFSGLNKKQIDALYDDSRIAEVGIQYIPEDGSQIAYAVDGKVLKSSTGVYYGDSINLKQIIVGKLEGNIPKDENEILIDKSFEDDNGIDLHVGDNVKVRFGDGEKSLRITGIIEDNYPTEIDGIIRGYKYSSQNDVLAYITLKQLGMTSFSDILDIEKKIGDDAESIHEYELASHLGFDFSSGSTFSKFVLGFLIVLAIVMFAAISLIYNAFAVSLSERSKYLGMLASVGATKSQKRKSVYFEGVILGATGIPIGIAAGIVVAFVLINVSADIFNKSGMMTEAENIPIKTTLPWWAAVSIVLISIVVIFISSLIPLVRASKVTPMDAIRKSNEIKVSAGSLKTSIIARKLFGYEGELASKNIKRNGRKSKIVIFSVIMSVVVFLSADHFITLIASEADRYDTSPYQVYVMCTEEESGEAKIIIDGISGVDNSYRFVSEDIEDKSAIGGDKELNEKYSGLLYDDSAYMSVIYLEDNEFNKICAENSVDSSSYYKKDGNGDVKCLLLNNILKSEADNNVFLPGIKGRTFEYKQTVYDNNDGKDKIYNKKFIIGDLVDIKGDAYAYKISEYGDIAAYVPLSMFKAIGDEKDSYTTGIGIQTENHDTVYDQVNNKLTVLKSGFFATDDVESFKETGAMIYLLKIILYSFVVMLILIIVANMINIIITEMELRRREFAILSSEGMTKSGFRKMIWYENILYTVKSLAVAIPVSLFVSWIMTCVLGSKYTGFRVNILSYILISAVVFLIISLTKIFLLRYIKKENIIETLKGDFI